MEGLISQARDLESGVEKLLEKLSAVENQLASKSIECVTGENMYPEAQISAKLDSKLEELQNLAITIRKRATSKTEQTYSSQF
jgi:hypothetical protein